MRAGKNGGVLLAACAFALVVAGSIAARTLAAPTLSSFSPLRGPVGQKVMIYGQNLNGAQSVQFNGIAVTKFSINPGGTVLTAVVPPEVTTGPAPITVTTPGGSVSSHASFTVSATGGAPRVPIANPKPRLTGVAPMRARVGAKVTLSGINLGGALWVRFHGIKARYIVPSTTRIIATVPAAARSGLLTVGTKLGTASFHFVVVGPAT